MINIKNILLLLVLSFFYTVVYANDNIDFYIKKANELKLYNTPQWLALIHYKKTLLNNLKSSVITDNFFLSKNGKFSPQDELNETIKSFFTPSFEETDKKQHPICQFPARFDFLNKQLNFNQKLLPKVDCKRFKEFYKEINPESISIIFPTTYMNNPASMFGHTLIRINKQDSEKNNSDINSIILNYGANTYGETSGIIYAFKGVFGLYRGFFSATPYYRMTNTYSNLENRDIWEYKLNYTKEESEFYTKHIWELIYTDMYYYFFKENCSYLMIETLNVLRPEVDLTKEFDVYTAPVDTVKVLQKYNFIIDKKYRPSLQKQIQNNSKFLNKKEKKFIKEIVKGKETNFNIETENKNLVFETAYKFLEYKKAGSHSDLTQYRKTSFKILQNIKGNENKIYEIDELSSPDQGHKIGKIGLSTGRFNNENYLELSYKPSYHELIDDETGFDINSEISFFDARLRYFFDKKKLELEKFDFIKIKSLAVQDSFFKPVSFTVLFGVNNLYDDYKVLLLDINGGFTFGNDIFSTFFLVGPKINYSGLFYSDFTFGFNGVAGVLANFKYFKFVLDFKTSKMIQGKYNYDQINFEGNYILTKNFLINLKFQRYFYNDFKNKNDISAGIRILF